MTDLLSETSYRVAVGNSLQKCFANWSKIPPHEWAEAIYRLPAGGRFKWSYAPYAREMFDSLFDRRNIETVFQLYSRGLKSTVILLALGYVIDQAPRRILSLWPTNSQAEKWSKDILVGELFDTTEPLRFLGSSCKKRTGNVTLLHKAFPGGLIDMFGANAPGDMRRAKGSFLYADEIDAIESTQTDEGDQLAIFLKRGAEYPDTINVFASYPSIKGASRINSRLLETDCCQWRSTCVLCGGEPFTMHRGMLRYDEGKPETALLECPRCHGALDDDQRYAMAHRQGDRNWVATLPYRGKRGFQANALLWPHPVDRAKYPGGFLQMLAQQEIDAGKAENPRRALRVLVNTVDAECFDPTEETEKPPEWKVIYDRREDYTLAPLESRIAAAMVDVQRNRLEIEWKVFAQNEESWGIRHVVLEGDTLRPEIWEGPLVRELERGVKRMDGAHMALSRAYIDAGWAGDMVKYFLDYIRDKQRPIYGKVRASKGEDRGPIVTAHWRTVTKNLKGWHLGTWAAKELINNRLRMDAPGPGFMHYSKAYDEEFFKQLCTAVPTLVFEKGEEVRKYLNKEKVRDEALDLAVGTIAAFRSRRWQFESIEAELQATIPQAVTAPPVPELPPVRRRVGVTW
jgi:phage terminase large subunit GpA-like protein